MRDVINHLTGAGAQACLPSPEDAVRLAGLFSGRLGMQVCPRSITGTAAGILCLGSAGWPR